MSGNIEIRWAYLLASILPSRHQNIVIPIKKYEKADINYFCSCNYAYNYAWLRNFFQLVFLRILYVKKCCLITHLISFKLPYFVLFNNWKAFLEHERTLLQKQSVELQERSKFHSSFVNTISSVWFNLIKKISFFVLRCLLTRPCFF